MPVVALDACCLIDVLASGHAEAILRACGYHWRLPTAVKDEIQFLRRYDPTDSFLIVSMPADLTPLITTGLLAVCQPDSRAELDLFTRYAALVSLGRRSDVPRLGGISRLADRDRR